MKKGLKTKRHWGNMIGCLLVILLGVRHAWAAEGPANWRSTYDAIFLWINFGIFVFIIFKVVRSPIKNFIRDQRRGIERTLSQLEKQQKEIEDKLDAAVQTFNESADRFAELKEKILEQGIKRKQQLIEDARTQSRLMIEDAKVKIEYQIHQARNMLKSELIDIAVDLASEKLVNLISIEDHKEIIERYLNSIPPK